MNKTNKKFKDPGSAITHLIAMIGAVICAFPLIGKAVHTNNSIVVFAMSVFISSMILLYGASTLYHSLDISKKVNLFFRRIQRRICNIWHPSCKGSIHYPNNNHSCPEIIQHILHPLNSHLLYI